MGLARPPWLPKHHLALFEDYKDLARARLQELSEKPIQAPSSQAIEEAIAAIKEFAETSKIPKCLSDCWMWQRDTWNTRLLPAIPLALLTLNFSQREGKDLLRLSMKKAK